MVNEYVRLSSYLDMTELCACNTGYMDDDDCSWYHRNWIHLRRLGIVSNPFWHERFFEQQLKANLIYKNLKTLVLGTADFSMPYLCDSVGIKELYISDICLTPLNICKVIASREGYNWHTFACDICKGGIPRQYDLIVNDAFLTRFNYSEKKNVLFQIGQGLNSGGKYITTIRKGWNNGKPLVPSKSEKETFIRKAVELTQNSLKDIVAKAAWQYIEKMISYPIKDVDSLDNLCGDIFTIEYISSVGVPGECVESTYFEVVFAKI